MLVMLRLLSPCLECKHSVYGITSTCNLVRHTAIMHLSSDFEFYTPYLVLQVILVHEQIKDLEASALMNVNLPSAAVIQIRNVFVMGTVDTAVLRKVRFYNKKSMIDNCPDIIRMYNKFPHKFNYRKLEKFKVQFEKYFKTSQHVTEWQNKMVAMLVYRSKEYV